MSVPNLTDAQKLNLLKRFAKLSRSAEACIHHAESAGQIMVLLDALQWFGEGRLEATPTSWGNGCIQAKAPGLQAACELDVRRVLFSPTVRHYVNLFEVRCVGELYYIDIGGQANDEMLESLYLRFGIPVDADPVALGWKPTYWQDTSLRLELARLILSEKGCYFPRKYHKQGIHYFGETLSRAGNFGRGKQRYAQFLSTRELLQSSSSRLWSTFVVPPDWVAPNWADEELWKAELPRIAEDRRKRLEDMREIREWRRERKRKKE